MKQRFKDIGKHIVNGITRVIPVILLFSIFMFLDNVWIERWLDVRVSSIFYILIIPFLTAFIANSITNKIVIIPGLILGYMMETWGLGFLGGILGGLFLGYLARCICRRVHIKKEVLNFIVGYVVIGAVLFGLGYLFMYYMARPGIILILDSVMKYVESIPLSNLVYIVFVLSFLTVIDLGGPFNKLAYGFMLQFYLMEYYDITGPMLMSVFLPPLGVFVAMKLYPNRFTNKEHKGSYFALIGGIFGMTEGALAVGFRRPLKVIPVLLVGSVGASCVAAYLGLWNPYILTGALGVIGSSNPFIYVLISLGSILLMQGLFFFTLKKEID